jgi:hypothetical protein
MAKAGAVFERQLFYTLMEAPIMTEPWRRHDNMVRQPSSLGSQPLISETIQLVG